MSILVLIFSGCEKANEEGLIGKWAAQDGGVDGAHPMPRSASIFFRSFTGIALSSSRLAVMSGSSTLGALRGCGCGFAPSAATCAAEHLAEG